MRKTNEQGRSMIEMLGVLAIIGVLSVGGIAGFSKAMERHRINKTIQQVTYIAGNIRTLFGSQKDYEDLPWAAGRKYTDFHRKTKIVPEEMIEGDKIKNPFGGDVRIWGGGESFAINNYGISKEACIALATQDWEAEGLLVVIIEGDNTKITACTPEGCYEEFCYKEDSYKCKEYKKNNGKIPDVYNKGYNSYTTLPMSVEKAVEACDSDNNNVVIWQFH